MKKLLSLTVLWSLVILSGCFKNVETTEQVEDSTTITTGTISVEAQAEADKRVTGNQTCDQYIATMSCIAAKNQESNNEFVKNYESMILSLGDIPSDQLQETCTTLTTALQEHPTILIYNAECDMTKVEDMITTWSLITTGSDPIM